MDFGELMTVKVSVNTTVRLLELSEAITMIVSAYESSIGFKDLTSFPNLPVNGPSNSLFRG